MLLGIDIGTTNVKVVLVEEATWGVLHQQTRPLGDLEHVATPGAVERSVCQIFSAVEGCLSGLEAESRQLLGQVRVIGVCGQMHGCVLWSCGEGDLFNTLTGALRATDGACSNLITWQDSRCDQTFISSLPKVPSEENPPVSAGYGCATLTWLQCNTPESLPKYDRAGTMMDMVVGALCSGGKGEVVMSSQNAVSWGYFNLSSMTWHKEIWEGMFPVCLLPSVVDAPHTAGQLMSEWHHIPRGTKISVAMGDMQCSVYAARPSLRDAVLNMGSASQLALIKPPKPEETEAELPPPLPPSVIEVPYFSGSHLLVAAALGGGNTVSLLVRTIQNWLAEIQGLPTSNLGFQEVYERVMELASGKLDTTLRVDPQVWGERHAPGRRGQAWNVGPDNLSLGDVGSGVVRGLVENLHQMISPHLLEYYQVERVLGSGKVLQRYTAFEEHVQRVFKLPLLLKEEADAPLGAAMSVAQLQ